MPLPTPHDGEDHDIFMDRCMADQMMLSDYGDDKQRYAVCQVQWDKEHKSASALPRVERRIMAVDGAELRIEGGTNPRLAGYAAVFNSDSVDLGGFIERIAPGAFGGALADADVRALINHDSNLLLGRTTAKTLALVEDQRGLKFRVDLPDTQAGRDIAESVRRKDITGCSFSFTTKKDSWERGVDGGPDRREIISVGELFDVGPVTYPAYPDTTVAARSHQEFRSADEPTGIIELSPVIARSIELSMTRAEAKRRLEELVAEERERLRAKALRTIDHTESLSRRHAREDLDKLGG